MDDLSEVKKAIISILNLFPNGIAADRFNREFEREIGKQIPYADFLYDSLLAFLEEELKDKIEIFESGMNVMLKPIANGLSAHMVKLKEEEKNQKKSRHLPRNSNAHSSNSANLSPQTRTTRNRSPTMPSLIEYKPFRSNNTTARLSEQRRVKERLIQSQRAFILREEQRMGIVRRPRNLPVKNDKSPNSSRRTLKESNESLRTNAKLQLDRIDAKLEKVKAERASTLSHGVTQSSGPTNHQNSSTSSEDLNKQVKEKLKLESSHENLWDDELDDLEPPKIISNGKAPSNSSSLYYGVSDIDGSSTGTSSREQIINPIHSFSDDEEEDQLNDIKSVLGDLSVGDMIPVVLSNVNNPLKFWLNIRREEYEKQFKTLYKDMQEFYNLNRHSDDLKVTEPDEPYFAACCAGQWERVEPMDIRIGESVQVSFIDCGAREIINISQLRKLTKQFWKVPKLALCCGLGNIKPKGKTFTSEDADTLMALTEDQKMVARVLQIDTSKSKAIVELILPARKVCINNEMVRLNRAIPKKVRASA